MWDIMRWVHICWFYYCNSLLRVGQWRGHTGAGSWLVIQCVCKLWDENHCEPLIYGKGAKRVLLPYACKRRQKQGQNDVLLLFKLRLSSYPLRRCSTSDSLGTSHLWKGGKSVVMPMLYINVWSGSTNASKRYYCIIVQFVAELLL